MRSVFAALVRVAVMRYVVPGTAVKVATRGVLMLGLVHLTFTGVAGAAVAGAAVAGTVGVIVLDDADAADVPAAFVAFTVNV